MIFFLLLGWITSVRAQDLSQSAGWLNLVHYQKTLTGFKSEADGKDFFLSPSGRTNPVSELEATIAALGDTQKTYGKLKHPAACVFTSRKIFLEKNGHSFPEVSCPDFVNWRKALDVESLSLVFASSYPNNPASMFGHTFLRINTAGGGNPLLDYAINFAATTGEDGGVEFAFLGVVGGYEGHYSLAPYFIKVNEYNNSEARDLWEYPLKVDKDSINLMLAHLWELESTTHFDYYFLDENCSWQILRLLEASNPELKLSQDSPFYVIPAETVRILGKANLIQEPIYRPSLHKTYLATTDEDDKQLLKMRIQERKGELKEKKRYHDMLVQKAKSTTSSPPPIVPVAKNRPDLGHGFRRVNYTEGGDYRRLGLRLAQHDVLDFDVGHDQWSTLDVLRATVENQKDHFFIREMSVVDVLSLQNIDGLGFEPSWFLKFGAINPREFRCENCLTAGLEAGLGTGIKSDTFIATLFASTRSYGMNPFAKDLYLGIGPRLLLGYSYESIKILMDTQKIFSPSKDFNLSTEFSLNFKLDQDLALRLHQMIQQKEKSLENGISLLYYF